MVESLSLYLPAENIFVKILPHQYNNVLTHIWAKEEEKTWNRFTDFRCQVCDLILMQQSMSSREYALSYNLNCNEYLMKEILE